MATLVFVLNGHEVSTDYEEGQHFLEVLRENLGITTVKDGCSPQGVCGCCTIIMDGRSARACLTLAVQADGAELRTIEGVADEDGTLHPIQQAFMEKHALQCGFCTPGVVMSILNHLEDGPGDDLSDGEIRELLSGNLCRCTGYQKIIERRPPLTMTWRRLAQSAVDRTGRRSASPEKPTGSTWSTTGGSRSTKVTLTARLRPTISLPESTARTAYQA